MKKVLILTAFICVGFFTANAQVDLKLGWAYGFDFEEGGLNIGAKYGITQEIGIAAGVTLFFPEDVAGFDRDAWMIDFDAHFKFNPATGLLLYPLAGLNFTTVSGDLPNNEDYSDTEIGLNLGGGASFRISDPLRAYLELKYIIGDFDQGVLGLGIAYRVN